MLRDKLAATTIELEQKDDELEEKSRTIGELVQEHDSIVSQVDSEWQGELNEAKAQIDDLQDVRTSFPYDIYPVLNELY
jgi:chromosome segregation ATPase